MSHDNQVTNYQPRARSVILPSPCLVQYFERRQDTDLNASKQYHGIKSMSSQNMTRDSQSINVDSTEYYIVRRDTHVQKRNCGATHTSGPRQAKRFFFCVFAFFVLFCFFPPFHSQILPGLHWHRPQHVLRTFLFQPQRSYPHQVPASRVPYHVRPI